MEFFADWHTHSSFSDGRGSIEENVLAAKAKGLEQVAITDHGPANIGVGIKSAAAYLNIIDEVRSINAKYGDIDVKAGAEANIIAVDGSIDIPREVIKELDILAVGLHPFVKPAAMDGLWSVVGINLLAQVSRRARAWAKVSNTKALKEAIARYEVDFISHPDLKMPVDVAELARSCAAVGTALEINTGHHYDKEALVKAAAREGVNFVVNSDAHFPSSVGEFAEGGILLEKAKVPPERILNARVTEYEGLTVFLEN